jgi:hypothetical protein
VATSRSDGGGADAAATVDSAVPVDAATCDATGACNCLVDTAPVIQSSVGTGPMPSATHGGAITDGTYYLTSAVTYDGRQPTPYQEMKVIHGSDLEQVQLLSPAAGGGQFRQSLTLTTSGTMMLQDQACPSIVHQWNGYDATPTTLTLYETGGTSQVLVFTLQADCASGTCGCPAGSPMNGCGGCGTACSIAGGVCQGSSCVCVNPNPADGGTTTDFRACGGQCVDVLTSTQDCGACGHACATGGKCANGTCICPAAQGAVCNGACSDLATDAANCGACGAACGVGMACVASSCVCAAGFKMCNGACTDVTGDINNCGGCSMACMTGQACVASSCVCGTGFKMCNGACIDVTGDIHNCGGCSVACMAGQACVASVCGPPQYGCNGLLTCEWGICVPGVGPCLGQCISNADSQGAQLFTALVNCWDSICPNKQATDPCSTQNPNYSNACKQCQANASASGGPCNSQYEACLLDTP